MAKKDDAYEKVRAICLSLPDTKETMTWGKPHFRVKEKIFAGFGEENGKPILGVKLVPAHARLVIKDRRFTPAPYVGHKGWVSIDVGRVKDWGEIEALVHESYRLIAPRKTVARWQEEQAARRPPKTAAPKRRKAGPRRRSTR